MACRLEGATSQGGIGEPGMIQPEMIQWEQNGMYCRCDTCLHMMVLCVNIVTCMYNIGVCPRDIYIRNCDVNSLHVMCCTQVRLETLQILRWVGIPILSLSVTYILSFYRASLEVDVPAA